MNDIGYSSLSSIYKKGGQEIWQSNWVHLSSSRITHWERMGVSRNGHPHGIFEATE